MINGFVFNTDVVIQALLIVVAIICAFTAIGLLTFFLIDLVERDCRRDVRYDDAGKKQADYVWDKLGGRNGR